jgi:hypothetical protein
MNKQVEAWEAGSVNTLGLIRDTDGTWLALTRVDSKTFSGDAKGKAKATAWLAKMGYRTDGTKF